MTKKKKEFHTTISEDVKNQWDNFVKNKHHRLKGASGPELELAMVNHMKSYFFIKEDNDKIIRKNTLDKLKIISSGFKDLPNPLIKPVILRGFVKKLVNCRDERTLAKYIEIVMSHSKNELKEGEIFPLINIEGFCKFVDKLTQENMLK